jgi:hypothetical protein
VLGDRAVGGGGMIMVVAARPKMRIFAGSDDQVRYAREFVGRVLGRCPVAADATLLVSEIAANAISTPPPGRAGNSPSRCTRPVPGSGSR